MVRAGIQLYSLRNVDRPFTDLLELVADASFEGVEFAFRVTEADVDSVVATLEETGLDVVGAHVGIDALEGEFDETVAYYERLGCEDIVVPWLDAEHFASRTAVEETAARLAELDGRLDDRGLTLHYHNHDHEYVPLNGETGFDAFVAATAFGIELDLGLALHAGDDPVARLRSLGDRSRLIHLKDFEVEAGRSVPAGEGDLDLRAVSEAARRNDSDWLVYEYEAEDVLASLDGAAETVRDLC